jgi:hypothetical protein
LTYVRGRCENANTWTSVLMENLLLLRIEDWLLGRTAQKQNHRVADGDQAVDRAENEAIDELLSEMIGGRTCGRADGGVRVTRPD